MAQLLQLKNIHRLLILSLLIISVIILKQGGQVNAIACPTTPGRFFGGNGSYGADRGGRPHAGIDLGVNFEAIYAAENGNVETNWYDGYQITKDLWGDSGRMYRYAHIDEGGTSGRVSTGQHIGTSGNGSGAVDPHLHFEIRTRPNSDGSGWFYFDGTIDPTPEYQSCGGGASSVPKTNIIGRLWKANGQPEGAGKTVQMCEIGTAVTDGNGFFRKDNVNLGQSFCVRVDGYKALYNRPEKAAAFTYEAQIAGKDCYNNAAGDCPNNETRQWDRGYNGGDDTGYDFQAPTSSSTPTRINIIGRLWKANGQPEGAGITVIMCDMGTAVTDSSGFFRKDNVSRGDYFCARVDGYKALYNRPNAAGSPTYEMQVAAKDCYNNAAGDCINDDSRRLDRGYNGGDDTGYDFQAQGSNPPPANPPPTSTPPPVPQPTTPPPPPPPSNNSWWQQFINLFRR